MSGLDPFTILVVPVGFGLLAFIEPCSIGSTLIVIRSLERSSAAKKVAEAGILTLTRALFTGVLGLGAIVLGSAFIGFQRAAWVLLGALYAGIGLALVAGRAGWLMASIGPQLASIHATEGPVLLGLRFGFNIPACAGPLLLALLGTAAASGAAGYPYAAGFVSLALFGLVLSAPLVAAVMVAPVRRGLERLAGLSRTFPVWTGALLLALGAWAIRDALVAEQGPKQRSLLEQRLEARKEANQAQLKPEDGIPEGSGRWHIELPSSRYETPPGDDPYSDAE